MKTAKVVFAGTPEFAAVSLTTLLAHPGLEIVAVYTQPDRPAGRGRQLTPSKVKQFAAQHRLPIMQPVSFRDRNVIDRFAGLAPDFLLVAAYGLLLPQAVLNIPALACLNVHASLLPRWRGAAPIQRALLAGDLATGVSIMRMVAALDAGPILLQQSCPIHPQDTGGSLHDRLAKLGAEALITVIDRLAYGAPVPETAQDESSVCYASKIEKSERQLNWSEPAVVLERKIRALLPAPAATAEIMGNLCKVLWGEVVPRQGSPGQVLHCGADGLTIATAEQALRITRLQPPGKRPMDAAEFYRGQTRP